jgi:hypothetical protein
MDLINNLNKESINNPREGDIGLDSELNLHHFTCGKWNKVSPPPQEYLDKKKAEKERLISMYNSGIRNYISKGGITLTIRQDGTEYVDKRDMPA